jgi:hypothetical protein
MFAVMLLVPIFVALMLLTLQIPVASKGTGQYAAAQQTIQPFPPATKTKNPNYEAQKAVALDKALKRFKLDLTCTPPCWNNLFPGKTSMQEVFNWFDETFSDSPVSSIKGDFKAPNNTIAVEQAGIKLIAYSDDTQPEPKLRAFVIDINAPSETDTSQNNAKIQTWLPHGLTKHNNLPIKMAVGEFIKGSYYVLVDYGGWAVKYAGTEIQSDKSQEMLACPLQQVPMIEIFIYSHADQDVLTLIQSVNDRDRYGNLKGYGEIRIPDISKLTIIEDKAKISELMDTLKKTRCLPPNILQPS